MKLTHIVLAALLPIMSHQGWALNPSPEGLPHVPACESTPTTSCKAPHEPFEGQAIPMPTPENSGSHSAPEAVSGDVTIVEEASEEVSEEAEDVGYYGALKNYLSNSWKSKVEYGKAFLDRHEYASKYGKPNATAENILVLRNTELALRVADEIRTQRELAARIAMDTELQLYEESLLCLALNGYYEARGETADQEVATAAVVLNRLSVGYRDATTICEVITTPKQFSWVGVHGINIPSFKDKVEKKAWERSLLIARRMMDPDATYIDPSNGAVMYYNPDVADPSWPPFYNQVAVLGNHRFMSEKDEGHKYFINNRNVRINPVLFNGLSHDERDSLKKINKDQQQKV